MEERSVSRDSRLFGHDANVRGNRNRIRQTRGRRNTSDIAGCENRTRQDGSEHTDTTKGDSNQTYQLGRLHRSSTVMHCNYTGQNGTGNRSETTGNNNYVIQSGDGNQHEAQDVNNVVAEVAGDDLVTVAKRSGQMIVRGATNTLRAIKETFKGWAESMMPPSHPSSG
ncbi:hypothetical protein F5Y01DRAFT_325001 [Xylaria sp. FL0043]|nr:hypothetical protein F5Y01DRAFT_325001 [Xylaria sp. FL0043]